VVASDLLDGGTHAVVLEDGEVAHQVQEAAGVAQFLDHRLQFGRAAHLKAFCGIGVPRLEPLLAGVEAADAGAHAVGDHQQCVGVKEGGDLRLVGLELGVGLPDVGGVAGGVLELEHHQGQSVDEQHYVGPAVDLALHDGELVDG